MTTLPTTPDRGPTVPIARIRQIILPTDFSEASRQAIVPALALAREFGAAITMVYVVPSSLPAEFGHLGLTFETKRLLTESEQALTEFRRRHLPEAFDVRTVVTEGGAAYRLSEIARETNADLIVISTHGYTGFKHAWLGSTAERVVRHAPCPVLVVRATTPPNQSPQDTQSHFKRILVPTDFSPTNDKAMVYAAALGTRDDASYRLLHVIEPPPYPEFGYAHVPAREAELRSQALARLEDGGRRILGPALMARTELRVRAGRASFEIAAEAREGECDLIVAGTHGHSALKTLVLGSTAEEMVRYAPVPVLIVRDREQEFVTTP